jgi:hypothetical protein
MELKDEPIEADDAEDRETDSGDGNGGSTRVDGLLSKTAPSVNTLCLKFKLVELKYNKKMDLPYLQL